MATPHKDVVKIHVGYLEQIQKETPQNTPLIL